VGFGTALDGLAAEGLSTKRLFALAAGGVLLAGRHDVHVALLLEKEGMDVRENTTTSDGGLDESVELVVALDRQFQMAGGDTRNFHVLGGVTGELQNLSGEVLEDGRRVDRSVSANASSRGAAGLQQTMDTSHGEMETSAGRPGEGLLLLFARSNFATLAAFAALAGADLAALAALGGRQFSAEGRLGASLADLLSCFVSRHLVLDLFLLVY